MRVEVRMPNLGSDMDSGKVVAWLKQVGDAVARGEVIAEIETDKTTIEMESLAGRRQRLAGAGGLRDRAVEIVADVGSERAVGEVIAYLEGG